MTTGKCPECTKRYGCIVAYRWKARHGRRLYNARCHKCLVQLEQTALPNAKNPIVRKVEVVSTPFRLGDRGVNSFRHKAEFMTTGEIVG